MGSTPIRTADGATVKSGDRVFNYYDREFGTIGKIHSDGWFDFTPEGANYSKLLNGERIAVREPRR